MQSKSEICTQISQMKVEVKFFLFKIKNSWKYSWVNF